MGVLEKATSLGDKNLKRTRDTLEAELRQTTNTNMTPKRTSPPLRTPHPPPRPTVVSLLVGASSTSSTSSRSRRSH